MTRYVPTLPEVSTTLGVWAVGALMVTVFYKIALSVEVAKEASFVRTYEFVAAEGAIRSQTHASGD